MLSLIAEPQISNPLFRSETFFKLNMFEFKNVLNINDNLIQFLREKTRISHTV